MFDLAGRVEPCAGAEFATQQQNGLARQILDLKVLVPAGTPAEVVTLLHREIVRLIALPDVAERLVALGYEPVGSAPDEFPALIRAETAKWARVIRDAGIRPQ